MASGNTFSDFRLEVITSTNAEFLNIYEQL